MFYYESRRCLRNTKLSIKCFARATRLVGIAGAGAGDSVNQICGLLSLRELLRMSSASSLSGLMFLVFLTWRTAAISFAVVHCVLSTFGTLLGSEHMLLGVHIGQDSVMIVSTSAYSRNMVSDVVWLRRPKCITCTLPSTYAHSTQQSPLELCQ